MFNQSGKFSTATMETIWCSRTSTPGQHLAACQTRRVRRPLCQLAVKELFATKAKSDVDYVLRRALDAMADNDSTTRKGR